MSRAVVVRGHAQIALEDGVLDGTQHALVPRFDDQQMGLGVFTPAIWFTGVGTP